MSARPSASPLMSLAARFRALLAGPIARASIASLAIKVAALVLSFGQGILAARVLGTGGLGIFAFAMAFVQVAAALATLGYGRLAVREIPALKASGKASHIRPFAHRAMAAVLSASLLTGASLAVLALFTPVFPAAYRTTIAVAAILVPLMALNQTRSGLLQGFGEAVRSQLTGEFIRRCVVVCLLAGLLIAGFKLEPAGFVVVVLIGASVVLVVGLSMVHKMLASLPQAGADTKPAVLGWRGLPYLGLGIAAILQGEANTILLGLLSTSHEAGLFQPVARLAPLLLLPVQAAGVKFAPEAARLWTQGEHERLRAIAFTFTWTTLALTACGALAAVVAGPWLLALYGTDFGSMVPAIWILAATQVFNAACGPVTMLQIATGRSQLALGIQLGGLAVNVIAALVLIPLHGAMGAVIALACGIVFNNVANVLTLFWRTGFVPGIRRGIPAK